VYFGPQTETVGPEFWPTRWVSITLGIAVHFSAVVVAWYFKEGRQTFCTF